MRGGGRRLLEHDTPRPYRLHGPGVGVRPLHELPQIVREPFFILGDGAAEHAHAKDVHRGPGVQYLDLGSIIGDGVSGQDKE